MFKLTLNERNYEGFFMLTALVWLLSLSDESNLLMIFLHFHLLSEPTTICGCLDRTRTDSAGIKTQIANQLQSRGIIYIKTISYAAITSMASS